MIRPAGMSDSDSDDSDGFGFMDEPRRRYVPFHQFNQKKKIEDNLQAAIINSNLEEVKHIIKSDLNNNINDHLDTGWTPLMHACFHGQEEVVELLLELGADANLHCESVTPVMLVCSNGSAPNKSIDRIVDKLLEKDCIINVGDKYGETPLMRAISSGRVEVVKKLLDMDVNIEMRDHRGWTAVFVAVHQNQPEILELLISNGARLTEVDKSDRTLLDIAIIDDHQEVQEILNKHLDIETEEESQYYLNNNHIRSWNDYYPGITDGEVLPYTGEIQGLLYGMNCERLAPAILNSNMNLRQFLLMEESDMLKLGIELPFERQRLKYGLRNFHLRGWKVDSVAGLHAVKQENYRVLDCLTTLGSHLQQAYILEATLQYALRASRIQNQMKFEPPDSPALLKIRGSTKKILTSISNLRSEMKTLKRHLLKISSNNPYPVDVIKEKSLQQVVMGYVSHLVIAGSVVLVVYNAKHIFKQLLGK